MNSINEPNPPDSATNDSAAKVPQRRAKHGIAGVVLLICGASALAWPWVEPSPRWDWIIRMPGDLLSAEVNADIGGFGVSGVDLRRRGERHISIISRPLGGIRNGRPIVEVSLARPGEMLPIDSPPMDVRVILFWQTEAHGPFRIEEQRRRIDNRGETRVLFTPPVDAQTIHRIGVQVPDASEIMIGGIRMVDCSLRQRVSLVVRELSAQDEFGSESVNVYKGPNLLGRRLNYHLAGLTLVTLGAATLIAFIARRRLSLRGLVIAMAIPWVAGDLVFTPQLFDRAMAEAEAHRNRDERSSYAAAYDDATVAACDALLSRPIASKVAVISENTITVGHRLAYLAAPHMVLAEKPEDADFIVVLGSAASGSADKLAIRRSDTNEPLTVRMVQQWPGGSLLERTEH